MSQARHWDKTPISRKRSRCCKPLNLNLELGNTIDLEITTILENLSELNSTFAKSVTAASGKETMAETKAEKRKDANCGTENPCTNPTYKVSGCCANLNHSESTENYEQPAYAKDDGEPSDDCEDENSLGTKLRNNFLKSLNDLSQNSSLLLSKDSVDTNSDFCISDRINDLKKVEEKINFLKQQVPCMLP